MKLIDEKNEKARRIGEEAYITGGDELQAEFDKYGWRGRSLIGVSWQELTRADPPFIFIVNTDPIGAAGQHWIAGCIDGKPSGSRLYFYNSLGDPPRPALLSAVGFGDPSGRVYYWSTQQQPNESMKCGFYCLGFVRRFIQGLRGWDLYNWLEYGDSPADMAANEQRIAKTKL